MDIKVPEIADIQNQLNRIEETVQDLRTEGTPQPEWYNLTDACRLKGVAYNTVKSDFKYQPNRGVIDAMINGRKMWQRKTIEQWMGETDEDL